MKDDNIWHLLEHSGVHLCSLYKPHKIPIIFKSKKYVLHPVVEEIFTILNSNNDLMLLLKHDKLFYSNLKSSVHKYMHHELKNVNISLLINFVSKPPTHKYTYPTYSSKKSDIIIINRKIFDLDCTTCIEHPCIFIGRGQHPLRGTFKHPIRESDITLNISKQNFYKFDHTKFKLVELKNVTWFACWKDVLTGEYKYLFLPKAFHCTVCIKFDIARALKKKHILHVNKQHLLSSHNMRKECALALYLISKICIRVGNEKNNLIENDTIGCCSLRKEHIHLLGRNCIHIKFFGKDNILFNKIVSLHKDYYNILSCFIQNNVSDKIFQYINPTILNRYLNRFLKGLTAKVFRTMHASNVFQKNLCSDIIRFKTENEKFARLCNNKCKATSINNYIDPRIIYAFSKRNNIPIDRLFSNKMIIRTEWAKDISKNYVF